MLNVFEDGLRYVTHDCGINKLRAIVGWLVFKPVQSPNLCTLLFRPNPLWSGLTKGHWQNYLADTCTLVLNMPSLCQSQDRLASSSCHKQLWAFSTSEN